MYNKLSPCVVRLLTQSTQIVQCMTSYSNSMESSKDIIFEVLEAVTMMSTVFWNETS
jgi:hypothetical protein